MKKSACRKRTARVWAFHKNEWSKQAGIFFFFDHPEFNDLYLQKQNKLLLFAGAISTVVFERETGGA
jgi:hypothetical protein